MRVKRNRIGIGHTFKKPALFRYNRSRHAIRAIEMKPAIIPFANSGDTFEIIHGAGTNIPGGGDNHDGSQVIFFIFLNGFFQ